MKIDGAVVAVAGGAGFLGSHLVHHLIMDKGCKVLVLDNLMVGRKEFVNPCATFEWCDISLSEGAITKLLMEYTVDFVFNYVAMPYVPMSYKRPLGVFDINARGALMLMNASQDAGVKRILQVSSAEIYGDATGKINEEHPARPHSSYGASKLAIDMLVQARWREARTPCIALRQFNCCGERETHPYVIPEIISQLDSGNTLSLGNNSARDFLYAGDAVRMAVELLENGECGEVYNLGSEEVIKIYDLAHIIGEEMGVMDLNIVVDKSRMRKWEIWHLQSDNTKIYSVIKARPEVPLRLALRKTIDDYRNHTWGF